MANDGRVGKGPCRSAGFRHGAEGGPSARQKGMEHASRPNALIAAGLASSLLGIGLARFGYTPLLPALIEAGWFDAGDAAYLGAANFAGYLAGALAGARIVTRIGPPATLRAMMLAAAIAFIGCAWPLSFWWFFAWRFVSGVAGGALMVVTGPTLLAHVPPARRGLAGGLIFAGIGLGIIAAGTLVPALLRTGLTPTWLVLGALGLALTAATWRIWPDDGAPVAAPGPVRLPADAVPRLAGLFVVYASNAVALVPHMLFLVDYVSRGLDRGLTIGALSWVVFGCGAAIGPVAAGLIADRIGFRHALRLALLLQAAGIAAIMASPAAIWVSAFIVGAFVPGIVPLVLGRVQELLPPEPALRRQAWSLGTASFAIGQAGGAYALSHLFATGAGYQALFGIGIAAIGVGLAVDMMVATMMRRPAAAKD